ncbi:MAG: ATP binding protein [Candidatus Parvarchaeum acidophilus ARMAN-5]|uniref:ATP binding protein n=1 Tax=Candidatus Parvarchaeum acidophilus ARMAN-5 TaxID=662762 RepID=D6GUK1_PARA5|nr:MAG: ATP binding protein [Candidatus Parvarchaeum acidophilus ARMAN-5]EFD93129.1 MAG: ATP binding protein [Candidatus Parvarchaeum acidophilus ARMAN-5]
MKIAALFTGGKDSTYSAFLASKENELVCLMNIYSDNNDSYMFHTVGRKLLDLQADAMNVPLEYYKTEGIKEEELKDLKTFIKEIKDKYGIEGVVSGAINSRYQYDRINKILEEMSLKSITPLWNIDVENYLKELVKEGFRIAIISVSAEGLDKSWLGREINEETLPELLELSRKYRFHAAFEGGEAETAVLDGPNFKYRISIKESKVIADDGKFYLDITAAEKSEK